MAIYHLSVQVLSRSNGQSSIAAAAYRSGERLTDNRTGEIKYYKREVEPYTLILAPPHSPDWVKNRERLWNEVELMEKRKDSQLAREINVALPVELGEDLQFKLITTYIQKEFVEKGMIADIAIHRDNSNNPHAHVMLSTRVILEDGFGQKNRDWNKKELLQKWREKWAEYANHFLKRNGIQERIFHQSHKKRKLIVLPTIHLGHVAHEKESRGVKTERGRINRERQAYNRLVVLQKYREEKQQYNINSERVDEQAITLKKIETRRKKLNKWKNEVSKKEISLDLEDMKISQISGYFRLITRYQSILSFQTNHLEILKNMEKNSLSSLNLTKKKEQSELLITKMKVQLQLTNEKLQVHRKELGFLTEKEFDQIKSQFESKCRRIREQNKKDFLQIYGDLEVLHGEERVAHNAYIHQVASWYPDRPAMYYMSFQLAKKLVILYRRNGNKVVSLEDIKKRITTCKTAIQRRLKKISSVEEHKLRLQRANEYLEKYEEYRDLVKKFEDHLLFKVKVDVSKSTRKEYDHAISSREYYKKLMREESVSGRKNLEKQINILSNKEARVPEFKEKIQSKEKALDFLDSIMKDVEQAAYVVAEVCSVNS